MPSSSARYTNHSKQNGYFLACIAGTIAAALFAPTSALIILTIALIALTTHPQSPISSRVTAILFLLSTVTAYYYSKAPDHSLAVLGIGFPGIALYVLLTFFCPNPDSLRQSIWLIIYASLLLGIALLLHWLANKTQINAEINSASNLPQAVLFSFNNPLLIVPNDLLLLCISISLTLVMTTHTTSINNLLILTFLFIITLTLATLFLSRSVVLLSTFIALSAFFLVSKRFASLLFFSLPVIVVLADVLSGNALSSKFSSLNFSRIPVWQTAWAMFLDAPVTGLGPQSFKQYYPIYLYKLGLTTDQLVDVRNMPWAHNLFLEMLAERGIQGLLAFLGLLLNGFWLCLKIWPRDKNISAGLIISLLAFCFAAIIELTLARVWVWMALGTLLGLINTTFAYHFHSNSNPSRPAQTT